MKYFLVLVGIVSMLTLSSCKQDAYYYDLTYSVHFPDSIITRTIRIEGDFVRISDFGGLNKIVINKPGNHNRSIELEKTSYDIKVVSLINTNILVNPENQSSSEVISSRRSQ